MKQIRVCYMHFANVGICYVDFAYQKHKYQQANIEKYVSNQWKNIESGICYVDVA